MMESMVQLEDKLMKIASGISMTVKVRVSLFKTLTFLVYESENRPSSPVFRYINMYLNYGYDLIELPEIENPNLIKILCKNMPKIIKAFKEEKARIDQIEIDCLNANAKCLKQLKNLE
jgi:hypothetical protein